MNWKFWKRDWEIKASQKTQWHSCLFNRDFYKTLFYEKCKLTGKERAYYISDCNPSVREKVDVSYAKNELMIIFNE